MTGVIRAPRPDRGYFDVKNETARDSRLSYRARGVLMRILSNADGFRMTAVDLAREGKEGRDAVLASFKELRATGYMVTKKTQDKSGRWSTETYVFDTPQETEVGKPDPGKPDPEKPGSGYPASGEPDAGESGSIKKHHEKDHQKDEAAAPPQALGRKKRGDEVVKHGVELWTAGDFQQLEVLIQRHGVALVEEVAESLTARDGRLAPLVSDVTSAFQERRRRAEEARRRKKEQKEREEMKNKDATTSPADPFNSPGFAAGKAAREAALRQSGA